MTHLLVAGKLHPAGEALLAELPSRGITVDYVEEVSEPSYAPLIHKADALVIRTQPLTAATIAKAERLKVVSRHGVGYDSVDLEALNARNIGLTIVGDVNSISVAEHAMMMILAASKSVLRADHAVRDPAQWSWRNRMEAREISGKRLLIIGYGRIGQHIARMAQGFDLNINAYDPFLEARGWPKGPVSAAADLDEALAWADIVTLNIPRGKEPLLNAERLAKMRPGSVLVNAARGGVVDEAALSEALRSGQIFAAGLDVFDDEPPGPDFPFAGQDNVVLSPHIAGLTDECGQRMAISSIENALTFLDGAIDPDLVVNRKTHDAR
ncbi:MAG: hydroxyacid dehydrogenase [Qingshengfaniella sp.]